MIVDLIVNPASGPESRHLPRPGRAAFVSRLLRDLGATAVRITETRGAGDGARAARAALEGGTDRVVVWGGDGTLNEVASCLLDTGVALGIVAGGSGNGLARGLGLPLAVDAAARVAMQGEPRDIDTGAADRHVFLNLAGIGFDALVAGRFNTDNVRRGLLPYLTSILREWHAYRADTFQVRLDDAPPFEVVADFVVVCNGQQYGHGARVAAAAAFDDGLLDFVAVPPITAMRLARHGWRLFNGTLAGVPGVVTGRARRVHVTQDRPLHVHLDGEVQPAARTHAFEVRPRSLRVMQA